MCQATERMTSRCRCEAAAKKMNSVLLLLYFLSHGQHSFVLDVLTRSSLAQVTAAEFTDHRRACRVL